MKNPYKSTPEEIALLCHIKFYRINQLTSRCGAKEFDIRRYRHFECSLETFIRLVVTRSRFCKVQTSILVDNEISCKEDVQNELVHTAIIRIIRNNNFGSLISSPAPIAYIISAIKSVCIDRTKCYNPKKNEGRLIVRGIDCVFPDEDESELPNWDPVDINSESAILSNVCVHEIFNYLISSMSSELTLAFCALGLELKIFSAEYLVNNININKEKILKQVVAAIRNTYHLSNQIAALLLKHMSCFNGKFSKSAYSLKNDAQKILITALKTGALNEHENDNKI